MFGKIILEGFVACLGKREAVRTGSFVVAGMLVFKQGFLPQSPPRIQLLISSDVV